jgi:hypothetical protein
MWGVSSGFDVPGNVYQRESTTVSRTFVAIYGMFKEMFYLQNFV